MRRRVAFLTLSPIWRGASPSPATKKVGSLWTGAGSSSNRRHSRNVLFEHKDALLAELLERSLWTRCLPEGSWCSFLDDDFCHVHKPDHLSLRELVMLAFLAVLQRRVHFWELNTSSCLAPSAW